MSKNLVDPSRAIKTGDPADLPYVVLNDHAIVVLDKEGREWPVTFANAKTLTDLEVPIAFDNNHIPDCFPRFQKVFPAMYNTPNEVIDRKYNSYPKLAADILDEPVSLLHIQEPSMEDDTIVTGEFPLDPREPYEQRNLTEHPWGIRIIPHSTTVLPKRSAYKPKVYKQHYIEDRMNGVELAGKPPNLSKVVRKIFDSSRRAQYTFCDGEYRLLESPTKLIRMLCAYGFRPMPLRATANLFTHTGLGLSFMAEYKGAAFIFNVATESNHKVWEVLMVSASEKPSYRTGERTGTFAPYSVPGYALGNNTNVDFAVPLMSLGSMSHVGARGVPEPLVNLIRIAFSIENTPPVKDDRPMRYRFQMQHRWAEVSELVHVTVGPEFAGKYAWACEVLPGPVLRHKVTFTDHGLRLTLAGCIDLRQRIHNWVTQHAELIHCDLTWSVFQDDRVVRAAERPFSNGCKVAASLYMPDTTQTQRQAAILGEFFLEFPDLVEQSKETDEFGGQV